MPLRTLETWPHGAIMLDAQHTRFALWAPDAFYVSVELENGKFDFDEKFINSFAKFPECKYYLTSLMKQQFILDDIETLGFNGPDRRLVFSGFEALGFDGPDRRLVFSGLLIFRLRQIDCI